jgi:hypothetical protein
MLNETARQLRKQLKEIEAAQAQLVAVRERARGASAAGGGGAAATGDHRGQPHAGRAQSPAAPPPQVRGRFHRVYAADFG